jgi:NADH:ubiquinone oxidoreductase subunit 6 (subunit J)
VSPNNVLSKRTNLFISNDSSTNHNTRKRIIQSWAVHGLTVLTLVALTSGSATALGKPATLTKVGVVLFVAAWAGLCLLLVIMVVKSSLVQKGERRLIIAVAISVPFILVRLIYSMVVVFANNRHFNIVTGSVTINLVMAVLEEFVVTIVCISVGLTLQIRPKESTERVDNVQHNDKMQIRGKHVSQHARPRRRGGPITQLIGLARDHWA